MDDTEPTVNVGAAMCPHCLAVQEGALTPIATLQIHACKTCAASFIITDTSQQYTTARAVIDLEP